jgi:hypothetical protein
MLVGIALIQAGMGYFETAPTTNGAVSIWADDTPPLPADWQPRRSQPGPDVYYLVFDRYGNQPALQKYFGYDNSGFYDELEKRGFVVDRNAVTSYPMTALAMSSTLNMRYLSDVFTRPSDYFPSLERHEVGECFVEAGYEYHHFGNHYEPLRRNELAHSNMPVSMLPSEFADSLVGMTPLGPLLRRPFKRRLTVRQFDSVAALAKNPAATFAYAHFLVPHPPYVFRRDGSAQTEYSRAALSEQQLYVEQVAGTNELILRTIDKILGDSATKPVIILQADEGPYVMPGDRKLSREGQVAKRVSILNAILIPDAEIAEHMPRPLAPVNTFRYLLKEYFAAPLEMLPARTFYWENAKPNGVPMPGSRIVEVTGQIATADMN